MGKNIPKGVFFVTKRKTRILVITYAAAAIAALGLYSFAVHGQLERHSYIARYSSAQAFEQTVAATEALSMAMQKSAYATDGAMCSLICSEAYADALAAETAMSSLPFSTQELEQLSAFLNVAGDYAHCLSYEAAAEGFNEKQVRELSSMGRRAEELAKALREMQGSVNRGDIIMDSRVTEIANVGVEDGDKLSGELLDYEAQFDCGSTPDYDGKYALCQESGGGLRLTEEDMLRQAAEFAGVSKEALKKEYDYEGGDGRHCYSAGEMMICVSSAGVESMASTRLVSDISISEKEAQSAAESFLQNHGFENLALINTRSQGAVLRLEFAGLEGDALYLDNTLTVAVAMDDGSIYAFNAADYCADKTGAEFTVSQEQAEEKLPQSLKALEARKVILKSDGGKALPCYEFSCSDKNRREVTIYVDAQTGIQRRINISGATVSA